MPSTGDDNLTFTDHPVVPQCLEKILRAADSVMWAAAFHMYFNRYYHFLSVVVSPWCSSNGREFPELQSHDPNTYCSAMGLTACLWVTIITV